MGRIHPKSRNFRQDVRRLRRRLRPLVPEAVDALAEVLRCGNYTQRLKAAGMVLDRYYGKPVESLDVSIQGQPPVQINALTLAALPSEQLNYIVDALDRLKDAQDPAALPGADRREPSDDMPEPELIFPDVDD